MNATPISDSTLTVIYNVLCEATEHGRLSKTEYGQAMRAVNTMDEAKAALDAAVMALEGQGPIASQCRAVLAKMEGVSVEAPR